MPPALPDLSKLSINARKRDEDSDEVEATVRGGICHHRHHFRRSSIVVHSHSMHREAR